MPKFRVLRRVDAWIDYIAEVEAATPLDATRRAYRDPRLQSWSRTGDEEFPNAMFVALNADGEELSDTVFVRG